MNGKHNKKLTPVAKKLRKNMKKEERRLWYDFLRGYPVRFLRQKVIGDYVVDFYCASAKLVVELDGSQHYEADGAAKDKVRTEFCRHLICVCCGLEIMMCCKILRAYARQSTRQCRKRFCPEQHRAQGRSGRNPSDLAALGHLPLTREALCQKEPL